MKMVRATMTLAILVGSAFAAFIGCGTDPLPPDSSAGGNGSGGSGGMANTNCGDGKLDANETCDDGNNLPGDGCSSCAVDECYTCTVEMGALSSCSVTAAGVTCQDTKVCNGQGACVACVDDAQCGGGYCHDNLCAKCDDGTKNGDETAMDCGGSHCGKCADGDTCLVADDCTSTFCADGVCCANACDGECRACNLAGSEGICEFIAKYDEDLSYGAGLTCTVAEGKACNGGGTCAAAIGTACTANSDCASIKCFDNGSAQGKICVKNAGEPCTMNAECLSNMCDTGTMTCT